MLRRLLYRPLYIRFTEDRWRFYDDKPRLRHNIKILMTVTLFGRYDKKFRPGLYEVKMKMHGRQPALVFLPLSK